MQHGILVYRTWKPSVHGITVIPETRQGEPGWYVRFTSGEYGWFKTSYLREVPRGKRVHGARA